LLALAAVAPSLTGVGAAAADLAYAMDRVVADRGYAALAPENTLAAVRAAIDAGATTSWADVRATSDGVPVLLHDATLDRTTDCSGAVAGKSAADVASCDAGSWFDPRFAGEAVPTLAEALALGGTHFVLDLHDVPPEDVLAVVDGSAAVDRVALASEDSEALRDLKAARPNIETWLRAPLLNSLVLRAAVEAAADGVAVDAGGLDLDDIGEAHAEGLRVAAVGVENEKAVASLAGAGADVVATARFEAAVWTLGATFRTYGSEDFGRVNAAGHGFPLRLASGDFDNDMRDDLVLSAPYDDTVVPGGGWVGVSHGGSAFPDRLFAQTGTERDANWGEVLTVADYNADGFQDLVIGTPNRSFSGPQSGALYLWSGSAAGLGGQSRPFGPSLGDGARMGAALASGDFNGDGVDDLAVGVPNVTVAGQSSAGSVVVLPGRAGAGPITGGSLTIDRELEDVPGEPVTRERFGSALAAGDFNGDGKLDLAIGSPNTSLTGKPDAGSVVVVSIALDPESGDLAIGEAVEITRADDRIPGDAARTGAFGASLAAADFDGDGFDDLAAGSPGAPVSGQTGAGDITLLSGATPGFDMARTRVLDQTSPLMPGEAEARAGFGTTLVAGDLDADGRPDLAVGSPAARGGAQPEVGGVIVLYGDSTGLSSRRTWHIAPGLHNMGFERANRQRFGSSAAIVDLNGDGVPDLAIGAPGVSVDGVDGAGALIVAWGYDEDLPGVPTATPAAATPSPTPEPGMTPTVPLTATPAPEQGVHLPYTTRLRSLDRFPTPDLP
jgi:glycerophosphoryl diester phosphodiesterase